MQCRGRVRTKSTLAQAVVFFIIIFLRRVSYDGLLARPVAVKRVARLVIEKYYPRLTLDFHSNKRVADEIVSLFFLSASGLFLTFFSFFPSYKQAVIPSKRLRNKIAVRVFRLLSF